MREMFCALAAWSLLVSCLGCSTVAPGTAKTMTVLTYNIHHGEGTDGKLDLPRIAGIIRAQNPDLVALQEVDKNTRRTGNIDQAGTLARLTGMNYVFGQAVEYQGGGYGQVILSRWPIKAHHVHQLPQRTNREPRILLTATIDAPGRNLIFASTHLDHQIEDIRAEQAAAINQIFSTHHAEPALLAGDFNAGPESGTMKAFFAHWTDTAGELSAPTIPAANPRRRIDYILSAPTGTKTLWKTIRSQVLEEPIASDHRPVLAVVELRQ